MAKAYGCLAFAASEFGILGLVASAAVVCTSGRFDKVIVMIDDTIEPLRKRSRKTLPTAIAARMLGRRTWATSRLA